MKLRNAFILAWVFGILTALTVAMVVFFTTPNEIIWIPDEYIKGIFKPAHWAWAPRYRAIGWGAISLISTLAYFLVLIRGDLKELGMI